MDEIKKLEVSNRIFVVLVILLIGILAFWGIKSYFDFKNLPGNYPREITISAEGKTFAKPDIALIKVGLSSEGMVVQDVVKENTEKMNAVLKEIKDLGIVEKDIETVNYSLSPRYDWKEGQRIFRGYTLTQEIRVKIRDFEKIGPVLEKSTTHGANLVGDLQFTIDDPETVKEEAMKKAIEKAKIKAEMIASQTGLKLGKVINVYEDYYSLPRAYGMKDMEMGGGVISAAPQIQPGEQEVIVKINVVYQVY